MSDRVRVGIIGAGGIARAAHIPGYRAQPEAEIVAICDSLPGKVLLYVDDPVELFFLQVQGSGRVNLPDGSQVRCELDPAHASQLTRDHVTAAVHFVDVRFTADQVAAFVEGVVLAVDHPAYPEEVELAPVTVAELRTDLVETV